MSSIWRPCLCEVTVCALGEVNCVLGENDVMFCWTVRYFSVAVQRDDVMGTRPECALFSQFKFQRHERGKLCPIITTAREDII